MEQLISNYNDELNFILLEYYLYLVDNNFESDKSFDYIFNILTFLKIDLTYLKKISLNRKVFIFLMNKV